MHVAHAQATGEWGRVLPVLVHEAMLVGLFVVRRAARATSAAPSDWTVAIAGVLLPLGLRPAALPGRLATAGDVLQVAAVVAAVVVLARLGRRLGIVAAHRGVATGGPYRLVRHPAYVAYLAGYVGYLLSHPTPANAAIIVAWAGVTHARALAEERLLARDPCYARYCERVPWRYVPGIA